ncbi:MAG: 3-phosphoglycerate dehydrogenase [Deltaproteobacteria bacterium]|nr:MAG: 3-phosphoglycerate dehydrogenase [Deltaproteobacteria bacterium]
MNQQNARVGVGPFRRALVLENPDPLLDAHLAAIGIACHRPEVTPTDEAGLVRLLESDPYDLLYKRSRVQVTERVLDAAPGLFGVMLCCIGDDSVDKGACASRGVLVTNDPVSNGRSVAELVIGEILCLSRRVFQAARELDRHEFRKSQKQRFEVQGKTLGILGLGNIGKQVARLGQALGMRVAFHDNRDVAREVGITMGWEYCPTLHSLFASADIVTCHVGAHDFNGRSNDGLLQPEHFAAMSEKEHDSPRVFLNLARGSIHSAEHLVAAVDEYHVEVAMVDVFPEEPANAEDEWRNPYAAHPRIFATPHIGASTLEAQPRIARHVAATTQRLSQMGTLRNCVFGPNVEVGLEASDGVDHVLTVVHSNRRGTKKAVDDAVYHAGASNLMSVHRDFHDYGIAYEVVAIDRQLDDDGLHRLIEDAASLTGDPSAIRAVRRIDLNR